MDDLADAVEFLSLLERQLARGTEALEEVARHASARLADYAGAAALARIAEGLASGGGRADRAHGSPPSASRHSCFTRRSNSRTTSRLLRCPAPSPRDRCSTLGATTYRPRWQTHSDQRMNWPQTGRPLAHGDIVPGQIPGEYRQMSPSDRESGQAPRSQPDSRHSRRRHACVAGSGAWAREQTGPNQGLRAEGSETIDLVSWLELSRRHRIRQRSATASGEAPCPSLVAPRRDGAAAETVLRPESGLQTDLCPKKPIPLALSSRVR